MLADAHCHFFSSAFFTALGRQKGDLAPEDICRELGWDVPGDAALLADRWVAEMDAHGVTRAALIASVPGDEASVARAVARHPSRLVGYAMVDPSAADAVVRINAALAAGQVRALCLFPAMHHVPLDDSRVQGLVAAAAERPGTAVFVHCGVLSLGVRRKLGLPSQFDLRLGDPLAVARLAAMFPHVPFIIPHFGAGLFREALMAADACRNIYFDTSSSNAWVRYVPGLTLRAAFEAALAVAGPSRLLFGTDSSFFPRGWQVGVFEMQQQALDDLHVGADDQALIFSGNFARLFPLPTTATR